ncbi:MAG: orotidine-5'-phosphate decarboxylase [Armatimonadetes bacterium]|nr:orotidine-5'-phosphate decarboxylase [Armatimonadota bacterium]
MAAAVRRSQSRVCVGLDPALDGVTRVLGVTLHREDPEAAAQAIWEFNQRILDAVQPYCAVVKPQSAFYEVWGPPGIEALRKTIECARDMGLICILDAKRNDIASTAAAYADAYLADGPMACDAITVNPYLGCDGITPFLERARPRGKGLFALVKTSNKSSAEVQDVRLGSGKLLYEHVGDLVEEWGADNVGACGYGDVGAVVGATFPEELAGLRRRLPRTWFLIPGYGRQGGTAADVVPGFDTEGLGAVVNSSSGIIFAGKDRPDAGFAAAAGDAAREMREAIEAALEARQH